MVCALLSEHQLSIVQIGKTKIKQNNMSRVDALGLDAKVSSLYVRCKHAFSFHPRKVDGERGGFFHHKRLATCRLGCLGGKAH